MFSRESTAKCSLPVFMLKNDEEASYCGEKKALISCIMSTIMIIIICTLLVIFLTKYKKKHYETKALQQKNPVEKGKLEQKSQEAFVWWPILVGVLLIVIIWLFGPKLFIEAYMTQYTAKKYEREAMKESGLSKKESFQQQQKLFESKQQADARIRAARIQADATRNQTSALRDAIRNKFRYR